jgi:ankyrin repeat protein
MTKLVLDNTINNNLDEYYMNPNGFIYTSNNNNIFDDESSELIDIINTLTNIINNKNKNTKYIFNPILFKYIANNNLISLQNFLQNNKNININQQDKDGDTALHIAIFLTNINAIKILLKYNADILIKDKWGQIPLHRICFCMNDLKNIEIVDLFIQINEIKNINIFNITDKFGNTVCHLLLKHIIKNNITITTNHIILIKKIKLYTDTNIKNLDNKTILDLIKEYNFSNKL